MAIVTGKDAAVYATSSPSILMSAFQSTTTSDRYTYTISTPAYRYWDPASAVQVQVNGVAPAVSYTVQLCGGRIVFVSQLGVSDVVTVKCNYFPYSAIGGAHSASMTMERDVIKDTRIGDSCQRVIMGPKRASITLEQFWVDPTFFNAINNGMLLGIAFHDAGIYNTSYTTGGPRYECYGYIKSDQMKLDGDNVMDETIDFESSGDIYFSPS